MADEGKSYGMAWFLAGLGIGALVGILYAPKSGKETREDIAAGAREGTEYLKARSREAADNVSAMVDKGKERVGAFVDSSKDQVSPNTSIEAVRSSIVDALNGKSLWNGARISSPISPTGSPRPSMLAARHTSRPPASPRRMSIESRRFPI